jgi:uncharacterized oligopeptide transporter (OPT) family protein
VVFAVPAFLLITHGKEIGGEDLPAPAGHSWKAMAELLANGFESLPPMAPQALMIAGCVGIALPILRSFPSLRPFLPNGLAMGIAFIVPPGHTLAMFCGLLVWYIWRAINPGAVEKLSYAAAAGLIAGDGIMQIVNAVLDMVGVKPLT